MKKLFVFATVAFCSTVTYTIPDMKSMLDLKKVASLDQLTSLIQMPEIRDIDFKKIQGLIAQIDPTETVNVDIRKFSVAPGTPMTMDFRPVPISLIKLAEKMMMYFDKYFKSSPRSLQAKIIYNLMKNRVEDMLNKQKAAAMKPAMPTKS